MNHIGVENELLVQLLLELKPESETAETRGVRAKQGPEWKWVRSREQMGFREQIWPGTGPDGVNREMSKQLGTCVKQWGAEPGQGVLDPCSLTHTKYEIIGLLGPFDHSVRYPLLMRPGVSTAFYLNLVCPMNS